MGLQPHKSLSHNVVDDHAGGWYFLRVTPTRIANSKFMAIACIVVGALLLVVSLGTGQAVSAVAGGILLLLGILQMINPQLVITADEVQVRNPVGMTLRRFPISGPQDLRFEDKKLMHVPTGKKVMTLGFAADAGDVEKLRAQVG